MAFLKSRVWLKRLVFVAIALFAALLCVAFQPSNPKLAVQAHGQTLFRRMPLQDQIFRLFDLGVADIDGDGQLDVYTSNHSNEQFLLMNEGDGNFSENQVKQRHLNQDQEFPGLEYSLKSPPRPSKPGLYIYWQERSLIVETHQLDNPNLFSGNISVSAPLDIKVQRGLDTELTLSPFAEDEVASSLNFKATKSNGKLLFLPGNVALPFVFQLDDGVPLEQVFVGHDYVSPEKSRFDLFMRDRHGMAWRDINNDGKLDVFIVRGALKGRIDQLPGTFADELLVQKGDGQQPNEEYRFVDIIDPDELQKSNCPALQTAWVDANRDQKLDIFTLCYKPTTPIETFPPQLYLQSSNGGYQEQSSSLKLDTQEDGSFLWLDVEGDGDQDVFRSTSASFLLFRNDKGTFSQETVAANPGGVATTFNGSNNLTAADYDHDGDLDVFAASEQGNALLQNDKGNFTLVSAESVGLPLKSLTAQWVDYDNDGLIDLFTLPDGLYQQSVDHQFVETKLLRNQSSQGLLEARATWFDVDDDGDRDLITALNFRDPLYRRFLIKGLKQDLKSSGWFLDEYINQLPNSNHWLSLDLKGQPTNAEAIGAQVEIVSDLGTQKYQVGQSDGSHYSQGHYRLYAGLGGQKAPLTLKIRWPDGTVQTQQVSSFDQRLTIAQPA